MKSSLKVTSQYFSYSSFTSTPHPRPGVPIQVDSSPTTQVLTGHLGEPAGGLAHCSTGALADVKVTCYRGRRALETWGGLGDKG
jgi:hypothetical protein